MEILKKFKEKYLLITFVIGLFISLFMALHNTLNKYDDILDTLKTTKQMSLKSVIWNDSIPVGERTSACDVYLGAGYNSLTKKHCEKLVNESVAINTFFDGRKEE